MDTWHKAHSGPITDIHAYRSFLESIGYIVPVPDHIRITTEHVDNELALQAGPQLVVPILNARYALNAANARWGSLYDALYGTDVIPETDGAEKGKGYNVIRGRKVVSFAREFLDSIAPLMHDSSHKDAVKYSIDIATSKLIVKLNTSTTSMLQKPELCIGFTGPPDAPLSVLFCHNGIHVDIIIDRNNSIGKTDPAGISDIVLESALSTILDLEDRF